jgi:hypothetical protein
MSELIEMEIITKKLIQACQEISNEILDPESTMDEKNLWLRHVLGGIETLNQQIDDTECVPLFTGPFVVDKQVEIDDLNNQVKDYTNILIQSILSANEFHRQQDLNEIMNKNISELIKDPVFSNLTIQQISNMTLNDLLQKQKNNKKSKLRLMHWVGFLEELLYTLETFEEVKEWETDLTDETQED